MTNKEIYIKIKKDLDNYYKSNDYTLRFDTQVERDWAFDELTKILINNSIR